MKAGFTLIELMVSISIMAIVAVLVAASFRGAGPAQELQRTADNLSSLVRQAQIASFSGSQVNGVVPLGGFGINASVCNTPPCSIMYFADLDGGIDYDAGTEDVQTLTLPQSVTISAVTPGSPLTVIFRPASVNVCVNKNCSASAVTSITLTGSDGSQKLVSINPISGQVTVQ